jgi:biotin carboxyl carrier protein
MTDVALPADAWADVEPGTEALVDQWKVGVGDRVRAGQTIAVVVLVKTSFDILAPVDGVVAQILAEKDSTFKRGQPLARVTPTA